MIISLNRAIVISHSRMRDQRGCFLYHPDTMAVAIKTLRINKQHDKAATIEAALIDQKSCENCNRDCRDARSRIIEAMHRSHFMTGSLNEPVIVEPV